MTSSMMDKSDATRVYEHGIKEFLEQEMDGPIDRAFTKIGCKQDIRNVLSLKDVQIN